MRLGGLRISRGGEQTPAEAPTPDAILKSARALASRLKELRDEGRKLEAECDAEGTRATCAYLRDGNTIVPRGSARGLSRMLQPTQKLKATLVIISKMLFLVMIFLQA